MIPVVGRSTAGDSTIDVGILDDFRLVPCSPDSPVQNYPPDAPVCVLGLFILVIE